MTEDIQKWGDSFAALYADFTKPILDIVLFSRKLVEHVGWEGPVFLAVWYVISGIILKNAAPAMGALAAKE